MVRFNRVENVKKYINNYAKGTPELLGTYLEVELLKAAEGKVAFKGKRTVTIDGKNVIDFSEVYGGIILGDKGVGKTGLLNSIVTQLILLNSENAIKVIILDSKGDPMAKEYEKLKQVKRFGNSEDDYCELYNYIWAMVGKRQVSVNPKRLSDIFIVVDNLDSMLRELKEEHEYEYTRVLRMLQTLLNRWEELGIHLIMAGCATNDLYPFLADSCELQVLFMNENKLGSQLLYFPVELGIPKGKMLFALTTQEKIALEKPLMVGSSNEETFATVEKLCNF